jgi:hypothetical protein
VSNENILPPESQKILIFRHSFKEKFSDGIYPPHGVDLVHLSSCLPIIFIIQS